MDLPALLAALERLGYADEEIRFRGNPEPSPPRGTIHGVRFAPPPERGVEVTLEIGLFGNHGLLPGYFRQIADSLPEPERMERFIEFFENGLLRDYALSLVPERHPRWARLRDAHFAMSGLASVSSLTWLFQRIFPELGVRVHRSGVRVRTDAHALIVGQSHLDGSGVLGSTHDAGRAGFRVELFTTDELTSSGAVWWKIARDRVRARVLPLLGGLELLLQVRLVVEDHASWARVAPDGQLGYDRISGERGSYEIWVYRDGSEGLHG